jgi:hypothetical protein
VIPDGQCLLDVGQPYAVAGKYRFLIELDMATETRKEQFGRDKVFPGLAYLNSTAYREKFGSSGRFLIITTTPTRLKAIKKQAESFTILYQRMYGEQRGRADKFLFTTIGEALAADNILTSRIWLPGGTNERVALL